MRVIVAEFYLICRMNRHLPEKIECWKCKAVGAENFSMSVKISITRNLSHFRQLPEAIELQSGDYVNWDQVFINCKKCNTPYRLD